MKVLFLDIDGVLNSTDYYMRDEDIPDTRPYPLNEIDPLAVDLLNKIIKATGSKVVVSSSWRVLEGFDNLYERFGIQSPLCGKTPSIFGRRGKEILEYLNSHPDIENYVILDDYDFPDVELENEPLKSHFVQTNYNRGLTVENTEKAIKILTS